jgi:hypothetical protein
MRKAPYFIGFLLIVGVVAYIACMRDVSNDSSSLNRSSTSENTASKNADALKTVMVPLDVIADHSVAYAERLAAVKKLGDNLNRDEVGAVYRLLRDVGEDEAIRNDLLVVLEGQKKPVGMLSGTLIRMWSNPKQTPKWRDYCLQHMDRAWELEAAQRKQVEEVLLETAKGEGTLAETAMLTLQRIGRTDKAVLEKVGRLAAEAVGDRQADPERAINALQISAEQNPERALLQAREVAADESAKIRLRMSALAVIGKHGGGQDLGLLEKLTADSNRRLSLAAKMNLESLKSRQ